MKFFAAIPEDTGPMSDYWYQSFSAGTATGKDVNEETAMNVGAFYAGVRLIAETLGMLPVHMYRWVTGRNGKEKALEHPLQILVHDKPNTYQDSMQWREMMTAHAIMWGGGYSEKVYAPNGLDINELLPLHPARMEVKQSPVDNQLLFDFTKGDGTKKRYMQDEIFYLKGFGYGVTGISLLTAMRESLGLSIAAEESGARFFSNALTPSGVFTHPGQMGPEAQKNFLAGINRKMAGVEKHHQAMVLEEGMTWNQIGMSNKDSQFLESRKFQVTDVAHWLRLPPHMLADLERSTFSNIETQDLEFVKFAMLPWVKRWEFGFHGQLVRAKQTYFAEFNLEMLLRADIETRMKAYQVGIQIGILSRNEVRELENRNPYVGGDAMLIPLNMTTTPVVGDGAAQSALLENPAALLESGDVLQVDLPVQIEAEPVPSKAQALAGRAAERMLAMEISELTEKATKCAADAGKWKRWVRSFYGRFAKELMEELKLTKEDAGGYCDRHQESVLESGIGVAEHWGAATIDELANLALGEKECITTTS